MVFLGRYSENAVLVPHITFISYFQIIIRDYATVSRENPFGIVIMVRAGEDRSYGLIPNRQETFFPPPKSFVQMWG